MTINNFLFEAKIDNLNLFKIVEYCRRSQISKKVGKNSRLFVLHKSLLVMIVLVK